MREEKEQVPKAPLRGARVSLTIQGNAGAQEHLFLHLTQEHGDGFSFFPNEHSFLFSLMLSYSLGSIKIPLSDSALDTLKYLGKVKADKNSSLCCSVLPAKPTSNARPTWTPFRLGAETQQAPSPLSPHMFFFTPSPGQLPAATSLLRKGKSQKMAQTVSAGELTPAPSPNTQHKT